MKPRHKRAAIGPIARRRLFPGSGDNFITGTVTNIVHCDVVEPEGRPPGRQADAIARGHEAVALWKEITGHTFRVSVVTTGTLGRFCYSADYESMGAWEAAVAKVNAHPDWIAHNSKWDPAMRDGTNPFVPNTVHDEYWRDA